MSGGELTGEPESIIMAFPFRNLAVRSRLAAVTCGGRTGEPESIIMAFPVRIRVLCCGELR